MFQFWSRFVHLSAKRQAWLVFGTSMLLRMVYLIGFDQLTAAPPEYNEQVRMARYLLHGTGYVSPIGPERSDPSCWYPPGYIGLLTAVFWVFGEGTSAAWAAARIINVAALSGALALWTLLARFYLGRRISALAAVLMVVSPNITSKLHDIWDTYPITFGAVLCLCVFSFCPPRRLISAVGAGAVCGAAALVNPCFTLCYPVWVLWGLCGPHQRRRMSGTACVPFVLAVLAGFGVMVAPWSVRNRLTFGEWFYLRGNLPFEMWSGNAPWSNGYGISDTGMRLRHPVFDPEEAVRLVAVGEYPYFKQCGGEVRQWLRENPQEFVRRSVDRVRWFWWGRFAHDRSWVQSALKFIGFTVPGMLSLVGVVWVLMRRRRALVLVLTLMIFPLPYYVCLMMARYRLPLEPLVLVLAAAGLLALVGWMRQRRDVTG